MLLLDRELFVEILDEVKTVFDYSDNLNKFFHQNNVEGYIYQPDCIVPTLTLLHIAMGEADKNEWIDYFVEGLDFGRKWEPGIVKDKDGVDIDLSDAEKLYDFLIENTEEFNN